MSEEEKVIITLATAYKLSTKFLAIIDVMPIF